MEPRQMEANPGQKTSRFIWLPSADLRDHLQRKMRLRMNSAAQKQPTATAIERTSL